MEKKWVKWNENELIEVSNNDFVNSKKFKITFLSFLIIFVFLINLRIIEVLSLADGKVIPQGRIKYVQHLEGGIVEEILVNEGAKVETNQPLVILSKARATSDFEEINTRLRSIDLTIYRIDLEKKGKRLLVINDKNIKYNSDQLKSEQELLKSRLNTIESERKSKKSSIEKATKNLENLKKRLEIVKEQESISQKLLEAEATNRLRHLELLRELSDVEAKIDEQKSIITISKTDLDRVNNNYNEQLNKELSDLQKERSELKKRIGKYSDSLKRTVLKSPVTGVVKLMSVNSKGGIVAPGATVAEIVPEDEKLIIEANLPLSEIGYIDAGLKAKIRLNTPEGSRFRPIDGKVIFVGADRISTKNEKEDYYLVKIETDETSFSKNDETFRLYSGVPVVVGIITGKRSFIDYFLTPFKSGLTFALSER
tara:strand:- start:678 stop:1955 length:1278 start_codon:yes stop_codon:yes gene_type:complete